MQIFDYKSSDLNKKACVLALGNFDGVHKGHRLLLETARKYALQNNLQFGIYTFVDSPKFKDAIHSVLTDLQTRLSCFEKCFSPDFVYLESFDSVKSFSPPEFVDYIIEKFKCVCTFCGDNFSFGKGASGDALQLLSLMSSKGKNCVIVDGLKIDDVVVSSTYIKELVKDGNVEKATELLNAPYGFSSKVIRGVQLGHTLGFPTINQLVPKQLTEPGFGVYATLVVIDGREYMGVTNFGVKPTVSNDSGTASAETYIIDFDGDAYEKYVGIYFLKKLRDEKKFASLDELKKSIYENVCQTKKYFEEKNEKA